MTHDRNQASAPLATGFRSAIGDVIVTMDADLSHPAEPGPAGGGCRDADAVYASRYVAGGAMEGAAVAGRHLVANG